MEEWSKDTIDQKVAMCYLFDVSIFRGMPVVRLIQWYINQGAAHVTPTQPTMAFNPRPGAKYHIINAESGTLLDLSGTDRKYSMSTELFVSDLPLIHGSHVVIGWPNNGGDNQRVCSGLFY